MRIHDYLTPEAITVELQYNLAKAAAGAVRAKSTVQSYQQSEYIELLDSIVTMQDKAADGSYAAVYEQYLIVSNEVRGRISAASIDATLIALIEVSDHLRAASDCATALDEKKNTKE